MLFTKKYFYCTPKRLIENLKLEFAIEADNCENTHNEILRISGYAQKRTFKNVFMRRFNMSFYNYQAIFRKAENKDLFKKTFINGLWTNLPGKIQTKSPTKIPTKLLTKTKKVHKFRKE